MIDLDTHAREAARSVHAFVAGTVPLPDEVPRPRPAHRVLSTAAVLVLVVALLAGIVAFGAVGDAPPIADDGSAPVPAGVVVDPLPEGFGASYPPPAPSTGTRATRSVLFGDPHADHPFADGDLRLTFHAGDDPERVDGHDGPQRPGRVRGVEARTRPRDAHSIAWRERDGLVVQLESWSMAVEQLMEVAEALDVDRPRALADGALPAGLEPLAEVPSPDGVEGQWTTYLHGSSPADGALQLRALPGELDDRVADAEWVAGAAASEVVVRGRRGALVRDERPASGAIDVRLYWQEADGYVMAVEGSWNVTEEVVLAVAEHARPVDDEELVARVEEIERQLGGGRLVEGEVPGVGRWSLSATSGSDDGAAATQLCVEGPSEWTCDDHVTGDATVGLGEPAAAVLDGRGAGVVFGRVGPDVAAVRLEPAGGEAVEVEVHDGTVVDGRFFGGTVVADDGEVEVVALDADGAVLERRPLTLTPDGGAGGG